MKEEEPEETHVPCPVCRRGTVPASIARSVSDLLSKGSSTPPPSEEDNREA